MSFSSPLVHTHVFVVAFTSFKQDIFRCFCFSSEHTMSVFSQSVPWEQMRLSAPYRSSIIKEITHSATCLGSPRPATPRLNQAGPSGLRRRLFSPVYLLVSKVPTCSW